jgi:hypothetical protein
MHRRKFHRQRRKRASVQRRSSRHTLAQRVLHQAPKVQLVGHGSIFHLFIYFFVGWQNFSYKLGKMRGKRQKFI